MWKLDNDIRKTLCNFLLSFEIMIPLKGSYSDSVIVPSLLPEQPTPEFEEFMERSLDMTKLFKIER